MNQKADQDEDSVAYLNILNIKVSAHLTKENLY